MNRYYKRKWDETRGDEFDSWGTSIWYFEVDMGGYPVRQIELYENGNRLKYDLNKKFDDYGQLGDQPIDMIEFKQFEITKDDFEEEWLKSVLKKEHQEIMDMISDYLANNYSLRFGQALFNLGINEFKNPENLDYDNLQIRDIHGDSDVDIIERMKERLKKIKRR